jgi:D-beta-D-heptose 7-phosphate kinase/D-beta-D-heptose 1-phosphate adenosyltransferase
MSPAPVMGVCEVVLNVLDRLGDARIAIVGDVMLDLYMQGDVERISPEAPVPVIRLMSERAIAGGAANVAANAASLGARVNLVGLAGDDEGFRRLAANLATHATIDCSGITRLADRPTITKTRVIGQHQQIARIDREDTRPLPVAVEAEILERALEAMAKSDVMVLSDYGKGVLSDGLLAPLLAAARRRGIPTIVDPKRRDLAAYRGATLITPNRAELKLATGLPCDSDEEVLAAARRAQAMCGADLLVTRSDRGMSLIPCEGEPIHLATVAREVYDVSGAGDTVVAVLGACLAAGLSMREAMRAANHAAGIVVGKFGTATVTRQELARAMEEARADGSDIEDGRLLGLQDLLSLRQYWRTQGLTIGIANGCFDLLHPGHISLIAQAAAACDRLVVALNSDASVRRLKGPQRPIQSEAARANVIGAIKGVAAVVLFDEDTPYELVAALQPEVLVKGADYTEDQVVGADIVRAAGGRVLLAKLSEGLSTSRLIANMTMDLQDAGTLS